MFTHLSWPEAPRFASRLLFMEAISSYYDAITSSEDARVVKELDGLANSVYAIAKDTMSFIDSQSQARFEALLNDLGNVAQAQPMTTLLAQEVRDSFVSTTSQWNCSNCTQGLVCSGSDAWADDRALSRNGNCIALLKRLFACAVALARRQYPRSIKVEFVAGSELRRAPDPSQAAVAGITRALSLEPPTRRLALVIDPDRFDRGAFLSVLYVYFHEGFVHGLAGLQPGDPEAELSDPFAEGWMDWIAVKLLKEWASSDVRHDWPFSLRQAFCNSGEAYHSTRMSKSSRYLTGALAGQRLLNAMRRMDTNEANAWKTFLRYSVRVNASNLSGAKRGLLVRAVNAALMDVAARSRRHTLARKLVFEAIDEFVNGGGKWNVLTAALIGAGEPLLRRA